MLVPMLVLLLALMLNEFVGTRWFLQPSVYQ